MAILKRMPCKERERKCALILVDRLTLPDLIINRDVIKELITTNYNSRDDHLMKMSATSVAAHISSRKAPKAKPKPSATCKRCLREFRLNGPFNYAFVYGSWEIVRARKIGTTHTPVDYVVYRMFYAVILVGLTLFEIVSQNDLGLFFCSAEIWILIIQVSYAFIFLQNVLANNLHRDNVKHRQKIPERLIVTDEIEKGGHKFYIYKRLSILPTDNLYNIEKVIFLLYNLVTTVNLVIVSGLAIGFAYVIKAKLPAFLAVADVFLAPIPMRLAHVVFPISFFLIYYIFLMVMTSVNELPEKLAGNKEMLSSVLRLCFCLLFTFFVFAFLVGVSKLRDYIISLMDDSRTEKQQQSLRSQKRLARRRLMNFIEGIDGRIIGITLEKHSMADVPDEFIKAEKGQVNKRSLARLDESSSSESLSDDEEMKLKVVKSKESALQIAKEIRPPPPPRYRNDRRPGERYSSSSSETDGKKKSKEDDLDKIKHIRLPSPPNANKDVEAETQTTPRPSKIPRPLHRLGLQVKPRDSREALHQRLSVTQTTIQPQKRSISPPTPPFVSLVQTMVRINMEKKRREQMKKLKDAETLVSLFPQHYVKLIQASEERREKRLQREKVKAERLHLFEIEERRRQRESINAKRHSRKGGAENQRKSGNEFEKGASGDRLVASKMIFLNKTDITEEPHAEGDGKFKDFHEELTNKLLAEKEKRRKGIEDKRFEKMYTTQGPTHTEKVKGILVSAAHEEEKDKRAKKRLEKVAHRRRERLEMGKRGKPVYDPLREPNIDQTTTYHILGTKLKGTLDTKINPDMLHLYKTHPGIGTQTIVADDLEQSNVKEEGEPPKSIVAFHPVVKYFDVNEVQQANERRTSVKSNRTNTSRNSGK